MSDSKTLHDILLEDFSLDLPIHGGTGKKASPIVITSPTLQEAVDVQMQVLRCLGMGRGVAWRVIEQEVLQSSAKTVSVGIETMQFTERKVTIRKEGCYFVLDALRPGANACSLPEPSGFRDPRSGFKLPYQLAWLHFQNATDDEPQYPGLGTSVAFGGLGIKATIYIYATAIPPPLDASVESERVIDEFQTAVGDALGMNEGATVLSSGLVSGTAGSPSFALAVLQLSDEAPSWVILTAREGFFVKARITCKGKDSHILQMAQESIGALMQEIHPDAGITAPDPAGAAVKAGILAGILRPVPDAGITAPDLAGAGQDSRGDALDRLLEEFRGLYLHMAAAGEMPRAFTGIKADGRQFVVVLDGLGFDHVQYRQFLAWLCMQESITSYAYARLVEAIDESDPDNPKVQIQLAICASSVSEDAGLKMTVDWLESGAIRYGKPVRHRHYNGYFAGLQRQAPELAPNQGPVFDALWQDLRKKAFWPGGQ